MQSGLKRRDLMRLAGAGLAGAAMTACGSSPTSEDRPARPATPRRGDDDGTRILLAYFSRPGENYWYGGRRDLRVGTTEVLAGTIAGRLSCDVHRIRAAEPYSDDDDATVARNVREQEADARPAVANPLRSIARYEVVLLAGPLWNVRPPMIMRTFAENHDFSGKTVLPVTTYAVSGLGAAAEEYADACAGATIGRGLAVRGERVREARDDIDAWLRRVRLRRAG
jgi:flavodoxin